VARRFLRVALTGGIATGKSYCLDRFAALGVPVIDADRLARDAVAAGSPGLDRVVSRFGPGVLAADGALDRAALARIVFDDAQARRELEEIVHPFVYERIAAWFAEQARLAADASPGPTPGPPSPGFGIADVPLLFESGHAANFDRVIAACCSSSEQIARMRARDGLSEADARLRLAAQWPIEEKCRRADLVIDTSGSFAHTDEQVRTLARRLSGEAGNAGSFQL
jgi:dephospho-CoA kinase